MGMGPPILMLSKFHQIWWIFYTVGIQSLTELTILSTNLQNLLSAPTWRGLWVLCAVTYMSLNEICTEQIVYKLPLLFASVLLYSYENKYREHLKKIQIKLSQGPDCTHLKRKNTSNYVQGCYDHGEKCQYIVSAWPHFWLGPLFGSSLFMSKSG